MDGDFSGFLPAIAMIRIGDDGRPFLAGSHCTNCGETLVGDRLACPSCGGRDTIASVRLGNRGKLYNFTVVHRSYPGVKVPIVSAIVDLEGGGSLRGTLLDFDSDPMTLAHNLPVEVVFRDTGQSSPEGKPFVSYYFVPAQGEA